MGRSSHEVGTRGTAQGWAQEKNDVYYEYYLIMIIYKILIDKVLFTF